MILEGIGDVLEEDEAEDDVLVFRRVHVVAQLVGGEPELGLEADCGGGLRRMLGLGAGHHQYMTVFGKSGTHSGMDASISTARRHGHARAAARPRAVRKDAFIDATLDLNSMTPPEDE